MLFRLYIALNSLNRIPAPQIEPLLYYIWLNCIIKTPLKDMLFPCRTGSNRLMQMFAAENFTLFPPNKLAPSSFFSWLITVLLIKRHKRNFTNMINADKKARNHMFSALIQFCPMWVVGGAQILCSNQVLENIQLDILMIFGKLLVSKDVTQFISYIASYWCSYITPAASLDDNWDELTLVAQHPGTGEVDYTMMMMNYSA